MDDVEQIVLEVDERPAVEGSNRANQGLASVEKTAERVGQSIGKTFEQAGDTLVRFTDRSQNSINRILQGLDRRVQSATMSPLQQLAAQQERDLGRVAGDPRAIEAVTSSYARLMAVQKQSDMSAMLSRAQAASQLAARGAQDFERALLRTNEAHKKATEEQIERTRNLGEGIRNFIENPVQATSALLIGVIEKIGIGGVAIGATITAMGAIAFAGFEAAKSLGEYGTSIQNAALRTGLTTKEVGQFGFAAKLAGQDISAVEHLMRGLTTALEDNSSQGDKARQGLQKLGVAPRDLEGNLRPTGQILLEISEGLNRLPNNFERNKVAMDIFKRAGIEAIPVLLKLAEGVGRAQELNIGSGEETVQRFEKYHQQVVEIETAWGKLKRAMMEPIAAVVMVTLKGMMGETGQTIDSGQLGEGWIGKIRRLLITGSTTGTSPAITDISGEAEKQRQAEDDRKAGKAAQDAITAPSRAIIDRYLTNPNSVEGISAQAEKAKKAYEESRQGLETLEKSGLKNTDAAKQHVAETEKLRKNYESLHETQKILEKDQSIHIKNLETMRDLVREGEGYYKVGSGRLETVISNQDIEKANRRRVTPSLLGRQGILAPEQAVTAMTANEKRLADLAEGYQAVTGGTAFVSPLSAREKTPGMLSTGEGLPGVDQQKAYAAGLEQREKQRRDLEMAGLKLQEDETIRILELRTRPGGEIDTARQIAAVREKALQDEFLRTGDIVRYRESSMHNEMDLRIKIAEVERQQFDTIKRESEGLLHTLFTDPSKFGAQFSRTIRDAFLKPVEEGLSNSIAQILKPVIYGPNGQGGIAGSMRSVFGLGKPEAHISKLEQTNHIGDALLSNGALPVLITNAPQMAQQAAQASGGGLGAGLGVAAGVGGLGLLIGGLARGGSAAGPGMVSSSIDFGEGAVSTGAPAIFGGPEGIGSGMGILPGEMGGIPTGQMGGLGGFGGIFGNLGGLFGKGGGGLSGLATTAGLGFFASGLMAKNRTPMSTASTIGGASLGFANMGIAGTQLGLIGGAGIGLVADGLRRGGWTGMGEDIGGGAIIGARFGGPLGAAIGAAAGAGAGLLRMLIGGGLEKETRDKIKSAYGVDISDQGILKQITQTIKQSFGGNVDVGIRSPQIRDLIQLYASSTGQKFPTQFSARPVNLVESGGTLYQGASSYENGQAIGYSSSLPSYGGGFTVAPPAPGYGGSMVTTVGSYNAPVTSQSIHATVASAVNSAMAHLTVQMDPKATTAVFEGKIAGGIVRNGAAVTKAQSTELQANRSRRSLTAAQLEPGTLIR